MTLTVKMEGLIELEAALKELPKIATEKAVVRRGLIQTAEPIRSLASSLAPYNSSDPEPHLRDVIAVGTKTTSRQANPFAMPGDVTVYIGPTRTAGHPHAMEMEMGTFKDRAQPFMRPAWEARKEQAASEIEFYMWSQIDATAQRLARRTARLGN